MSCCEATLDNPSSTKDASARLQNLVEERLISSSQKLDKSRYRTRFIVPDMNCAACIGTIERGLADLAPVEQVRANLSMKTVSVTWDSEKGNGNHITHALKGLGYDYHLSSDETSDATEDRQSKRLLLSLAVAGFAAANIMLLSVSVWSGADAETAHLFHLISGLIAVPTVVFSGQPFFHSALRALSAKTLNMDVPISLAVILALGMSIYESLTGGTEAYFDASVTLLFFLLIGRYLDQLMRRKARGAVERLHSLAARGGTLVNKKGKVSHIALADIKPGMKLRVFPGERFPVDGLVTDGISEIDRSHVTGESEHVLTQTGDLVEAGALNLTGLVDIEAQTSAENSFLGEMRKMMEVAEKGRGEYLRVADRMAKIYAPAVHLLALISFVYWMIVTGGDWHTSLYVAIAVLIITCPCALGLAVPVAHVISANRMMNAGILIRDESALERLAEVDMVTFDKTGTLTTNSPVVSRAYNIEHSSVPEIRSLASKSNHPAAKAVCTFLAEKDASPIDRVKEFPGYGIEGLFGSKRVRLGSTAWVSEISKGDISDNENYSVSFTIENELPTHFDIEEKLREDAVSTVRELKALEMDLAVLSGDKIEKVALVCQQLGISDYLSNQKPSQKIEYLNAAQHKGRSVLMVGDGINDAPALAAGHVSMVPASASDVGRYAADFVFIRSSLSAVPQAFKIAKLTSKIVRQNFGIAIAYNCIAVPLAMAGFVTPLFAAIAMSASSILVVANSFRISFQSLRNSEVSGDGTIKLQELKEEIVR